MKQCKGITLADTRCKRMLKDQLYCSAHKNQPPVKNSFKIAGFTLTVPRSALNKYKTQIKNGASENDQKGHIYAYYLENDVKNYWKIGRTTQTVRKRLSQWGKDAKLKKSWSVKHNKYAERLIHLLFDGKRMYRYKHKGGFNSIMKKDGTVVNDDQYDKECKNDQLTKQIEWFHVEWDLVDNIITRTVDKINK